MLVSTQAASVSAPVPVPHRDLVRRLLAAPARAIDALTAAPAFPHTPVAVRHARLVSGPRSPEGWLALQPGLATVGDAEAWTSFAAKGATALAVGGVHGADRAAAYRRFREQTAILGYRRQAVYPVRAADRAAADAAGFARLPVGTEAWVALGDFTLRGKRFADLRQMRNRARNHGVVVHEVDAEAWHAPLQACWRAFLAARRDPWQIRWLSGAPVLRAPWGRRTFVATVPRDLPHGDVQAFCTVLPGPAGRASLDVMCRSPHALPGSMEALLVGVLQQLADEGLADVSLGPCPLAGSRAQAAPGVLGAIFRWAWGSRLGDRWFGFARLAAFKNKLRPTHEPVELAVAPRITPLSAYLVARIWALGE